jgi:hypothetical protein
VLQTVQALDQRWGGDLLMHTGETLDKRLSVLGMVSVKMLNDGGVSYQWQLASWRFCAGAGFSAVIQCP